MLSTVIVSSISAAIVAAGVTYWLANRRTTLQLQSLDIVDANGRVRGRFLTANGMVGLTLDDNEGHTRAGVFVNPSGRPAVTLFDDKDHGRVSLELVEVPQELT